MPGPVTVPREGDTITVTGGPEIARCGVESRTEADYTSSWRMVRRSRSSMFFGSISSAMNAGTVRLMR